ncbi:MAG TPA: 2-oxo-4-hydroxy-4-carboxy-5-ureidoimidazoline decarboxylase [Opitutae bacterium]|nr:OHCU decarboxylase [Opitutaceae bacterium]HCR29844.1 2-oxo-4-hydroxy-4-carboxy-5-ureidoimidazoline decarboxylase [Opitutae bacterium]|tara:strand:+ start:209 stop:727 length:519 start_codon:yes stop_codon:yes gene_type:complete
MNSEEIPIDKLNRMQDDEWITLLGKLYEHSPWVVEEAVKGRPFSDKKALQARFESVIFGAEEEMQSQLITAHPDLAAKMDELAKLTDFSQSEQTRAGFSSLPRDTFNTLRETLANYRQRFGHPFILCVSDHSASETLPILQQRLQASPRSERLACLAQIARIGWHRLDAIVS